jgi:hypothetical protein
MIFLTQKFTQIPPSIRSQTDCIISFSTLSYKELEALYREVSIMDMKSFKRMFYEVTKQPFHFIVITSMPQIEYYHNFKKIDINQYLK